MDSIAVLEVERIDSQIESEILEDSHTRLTPEMKELNEEISRTTANSRGDNLNSLYAKYVADPTEENRDELLKDVENFARRVTYIEGGSKGRYLNQSIKNHPETEISTATMLKVWQNLDRFNEQCKFSSWVYQIAKNAVTDALRQITQRKEVSLLDWKASDAPEAGSRGSATGTAPDGEGDPESDSDDNDGGGHAKAPILTGAYLTRNEAGINANLDYERAFEKLSARDQSIVNLFRDGYKPADIGEKFGYDAKWASNQLTRLKELLQHEMYIAETILHSCKRSMQPTTVLEEGRLYTDEGDGYCVLPSCRCKKHLTALEAKVLIKNGEAHPVYRIKEGEPVVVKHEVWAQQSVRVPRVGLNSNKADIERAYIDGSLQSQLDIEIAHEMTQASLKKLIVPFRPDSQEGRVVFTSFNEQRTKGSFKPYTWTKPEQRPTPADRQTAVLTKDAVCPKCGKASMVVSEFPDGARKYEHETPSRSCYLIILRPPTSKSQISNVIVVKEEQTIVPAAAPAPRVAPAISATPLTPAVSHEILRLSLVCFLAGLVQGRQSNPPWQSHRLPSPA